MRSRIVSLFTDAIASAKVPVLDVASRYSELGDALLPMINPAVTAKYGLEITSFIVENVSVPPEVESAIDKRSSMTAIGNLNDYVKYQMAQGMEKGSGGGGPAGTAAELAVGFGLAQQMMQQGFTGGAAAPAVAPELLGPAEAARALGVSEADVMAVLESGELKGKKIGSTWRITRAALNAYLGRSSVWPTKSQRSRNTPARRAARRRSGIRPSRNWCARSAALSRRTRSIARSGKSASASSMPGCAIPRRPITSRTEQRRSVQCQSCKAIMVYDVARVGQNCEFCGSPALVAYEDIKSPIRPEGVLPFRIDRNRVRDDIRGWWRSKWLAPGRLAKAALVDTVKSLYIPYWTFDARAHCPWDAEAGYYYYVNVEGRDSKGNRVVRQERRVRWEAGVGRCRSFVRR